MNVLTAENSTRVRKADATNAVPAAPFRLGYRPGLDGLRGAAIMTVVLAHLFESPRPVGFLGAGFAGVNTFFVLSGFLITSLLIEEWDESGKISFPAFYARRALRLLPALLVMVLCFLIYARLTHGNRQFHDDLIEARATVFYYMNWLWAFNVVPITLLRHTWSLSLEEQFYLVWPPVLWLLLRFAGRRSILNFIILGIFCSGGLRFLMTAIEQPEVHHYVRFLCGLDTRADSLLVGCGLAVLPASDLFLAVIRRKKTMPFIAMASLGILAVTSTSVTVASNWMYFSGWLLLSLCAGGIILALTLNSAGPLQRVFESRWLVFTGKLSYSLYIWHDPIIRGFREYPLSGREIKFFSLCLMIPVALGSYYGIERPFLRLKRRFSRIGNSASSVKSSAPSPAPS